MTQSELDRELRFLAHILWSGKGSGHSKTQVLHLQCSAQPSKEQGRHGEGQEQGNGSLLPQPKCLSDLVSGINKLVKSGQILGR